jgi:poly(3-hydroxybutyrate) depolymerase
VIPVNAEGCRDWWGYTGGNYAAQAAPQMTPIMNMVNKITSGY